MDYTATVRWCTEATVTVTADPTASREEFRALALAAAEASGAPRTEFVDVLARPATGPDCR